MSATSTIDRLMNEAKHTKDPERLWTIARQLTEYGAWDAARQVEQMATTAERARDRALAVRA